MNKFRHIAVGVVALFLFVAGFSMVSAQSSFWDNVAERLAAKLFGQIEQPTNANSLEVGDMEFGASGTRFPNGISADSTSPSAGEVRGTTLTVTATSTFQEISLGSRYAKALTFTAGATTTPGGLVSLQNTGNLKICQRAEINLTSQVEGSMVFSLATSTSATAFSGVGANLIASTTVGTGTTAFFTSAVGDQVGTSGMDSFLWPNGTYILGDFDAVASRDNATTTDYTTAAGKLYVNCHTL